MEAIRELGGHPAAESIEWMHEVDRVLKLRPQSFGKAATEAEKAFLAQMLESNMGAPRKAAAKKAPSAKSTKPKAPRGRPRKTPIEPF
jgi:hypothetical protein